MDKRGLTVDPNSDRRTPLWWEELGETQSPSPYATSSWVYLHNWTTEEKEQSTTDPVEYEFDNGDSFAVNNVGNIHDSGLFNTPKYGALILDEGGFSQTGEPLIYVKQYFGSIEVYDSKASAAAPSQLEEKLIREEKTIDRLGRVVNVNDAIVWDNSTDITNPIPNPDRIFDSMLYPRNESGITFDEMGFLIDPYNIQLRINHQLHTEPKYDENEVKKGTLLGQVEYEIEGSNLTITGWSHYNWRNDQPVRKAVNVLVNEKPDCAEVVMVANRPTPFWKSLGFECPYKGSDILIHRESMNKVSAY